MTVRDPERARLRWIDDLLTPLAIFAAVEGLLAVGFDVRVAFFGGGGVLHTIGFWFVFAIICIERYTLTVVEPVRRGMYQVLLWAAVISSCIRFEMLMATDAFVLSLITSLAVLTGVGVFAQRLTASMNRSLVKDAVGLDVMDAIFGRVRDRTSGVVLGRIDGELVERVDVEAIEAEEAARATDDARARRSLLTWLVAGTGWLALAGLLVELADPGRRGSVLASGARFAVATPLLLAIASMRGRRERVAGRGGHAPARLVHRRLGAAVVVLAVAGALAALAVPLVGLPGSGSGTSPGAGSGSGAGVGEGDASRTDVADEAEPSGHDVADGAASSQAGPGGDAGRSDAGQDDASTSGEGAVAGPNGEPPSAPHADGSPPSSGRDGGPRARPEAPFGGCAFASNGLLVVARLVLALALLTTLYRWLTGRHRVRIRTRATGPVRSPRRAVDDWLAEVGRAPLDAVPATAWAAIRDAARARGVDDADGLAPRELVHALTADRPAWEPDLRAAARTYERAVFGGVAVDPSARTEWLAALARLLPAIVAAGPRPGLDKHDRTA